MRASLGHFVVILLATGCHYQAPGSPEHFPTTHLEGRITIGGQPIEKGWVTLFPIEDTLGHPVLVPIQHGGHYATDKSAIGPLTIRVTLPKSHMTEIESLQPALASKLSVLGGTNSPLRTKTAADRVNQFDVDLAFVPIKSP